MVESGKEAEEVLDAMSRDDQRVLDDGTDSYDALDPYGDHPEAVAAARAGEMLTAPDGMSGLEAPMGVID